MDLTVIAAFATVALTLIVLPGPDWAFLLTAGTAQRVVLPAVAGLAIGYLMLSAVIAAGVAPLVDAVPAALIALTVVGGAYLLHVGVATLRSTRTVGAPNLSSASDAVSPATAHPATAHPATAHPATAHPATVSPTTAGRGFLRRGIAVSALNPKSLLFFLAFLPQFTRQSAPWSMPVQLFVLGVVWVVLAGLVYAAMGFTVQRTLAQRPHLQRGVALVAGAAMVLAGVGLLGEQLVRSLTSAA